MSTRRALASGVLAGVALFSSQASAVTLWTITAIPLPTNAPAVSAQVINASGIVGGAKFVYRNGTAYLPTDSVAVMNDAGVCAAAGPASSQGIGIYDCTKNGTPFLTSFIFGAMTSFSSINNNNFIVGTEWASWLGAHDQAVIVSLGVPVTNSLPHIPEVWLPTLGGKWSRGFGINDSNVVVGSSETASGVGHAFRWAGATKTTAGNLSGGTMKDLGTVAGGTTSNAYAINAGGTIVGDATLSTGKTHAVAWQQWSIRDLGTLGGDNSRANALNDTGIVVGESDVAGGGTHAFMVDLASGGMVDLNTLVPATSPGWVLTKAYSINKNSMIVGTGKLNGVDRAFLLQPYNVVVSTTPTAPH